MSETIYLYQIFILIITSYFQIRLSRAWKGFQLHELISTVILKLIRLMCAPAKYT